MNESMYKKCMVLESEINTPSVYHDLDAGTVRAMKKELTALKKQCGQQKRVRIHGF